MGASGRFAIYWAPPAGSGLAKAGASWLGWDAETGRECAHPDLGLDLARLTLAPRKYGFHSTMKPPFFPATGGLEPAFFEFASTQPAFEMPPLVIARIGRFEIRDDPIGVTSLQRVTQ